MTNKPTTTKAPAKTSEEPEQNNAGTAANKLSPLKNTANLVAKYAQNLLDDKRSRQFAATLALMVKRDPKLATCTQDSLLASLMACVHLDLMPNTPEQLAFIIPYKNHKLNVMQAQFQVGYKGMVALAYRSAGIASINAELVFPLDKFKVDFGTRTLTHEPDLTIDRTKYADAIACYAVAIPVAGGQPIFDVMSRSEIEKVRTTVKATGKDKPWSAWEEAMVKKTVIKRLTKVLPMSSKDNRLVHAAAFDSWAEAGKLKVNTETGELEQGELEQGEPEAVAIDHDKVKAEAAAVAKNLQKNKTVEGDDPHRQPPAEPANPDPVIDMTDEPSDEELAAALDQAATELDDEPDPGAA